MDQGDERGSLRSGLTQKAPSANAGGAAEFRFRQLTLKGNARAVVSVFVKPLAKFLRRFAYRRAPQLAEACLRVKFSAINPMTNSTQVTMIG